LRLAWFAEEIVNSKYMKAKIRIAVLITSLITGLAAHADPVLIISDGVTSNGITLPSGTGVFTTTAFDSSWSLVIVAGESKPFIGSSNSPNLEMSIQATSLGSANPLTMILSDNNFGPTSGTNNLTARLNGQAIPGGGSVVTLNTYYDTNNTLGALTTALTSSGSILPDAYNSVVNGTLSQAGLYSLTEVVTIAGTTGATYSLSANLQGTNQPCTCAVNFTCPSNQMICESDPIPDPNAEAAQIVATDTCLGTVPVNFLGAITNGICPATITYTFGARSGCGELSTCNQQIIVSCLPDCTITTASTVTAGATGLTASVKNAGTGATYSWTIQNGTITSATTNSSITYTAGTDTSNPIQICVTVTTAAGCESTCCATVTPKPPTTNLGSGDAATIGFWHNKNGKAVINSSSNTVPALGNWLAANFPCMLGSETNRTAAQVAADFATAFGNVGGVQGNTQCQFFAAALACYFTSTSLGGGPIPVKFGFNQSPGGTGGHTFNIGNNGAAFGVPDGTSLTVLQILQIVDLTRCPLSGQSQATVSSINNVLNGINQGGDIK
jgi:hypothetical protein